MLMEKKRDYTGVSIVFFCYDGKGRVFMGKRDESCRDEIGKWDIGAVDLNLNESPIETMKRGVREQYKTEALKSEYLGSRVFYRKIEGEKVSEIGLDFKVLIDGDKIKDGKLEKFKAIGFFNLKNMPIPSESHSQLPIFLEKYKDKLK
jgi:hypothetical protein